MLNAEFSDGGDLADALRSPCPRRDAVAETLKAVLAAFEAVGIGIDVSQEKSRFLFSGAATDGRKEFDASPVWLWDWSTVWTRNCEIQESGGDRSFSWEKTRDFGYDPFLAVAKAASNVCGQLYVKRFGADFRRGTGDYSDTRTYEYDGEDSRFEHRATLPSSDRTSGEEYLVNLMSADPEAAGKALGLLPEAEKRVRWLMDVRKEEFFV